MRIHPLIACPSCGSSDARDHSIGGSTRLNRCISCELVYAKEYVDPDDIYVDGYLSGGSEVGFGLDIFHPYFQAFLGYAGDLRMRRIARFARPPGRLLDVGCGSGEVLQAAMRHAWTATGVEPVQESAKIAQDRGLDVHATLLEDSGLPERSFDVVTAIHVLEHMSDATTFLRILAGYAAPGGHVVVEVPNLRSMHRRSFGPDWPGLRPLEHISHFEPKTLAAAFRRAGLEMVTVSSMGFLWRGQSVGEALADLGLRRWTRFVARFSPQREVTGRDDHVARPLVWTTLRAVQRAYDVASVGQVLVAAARVP